MKDDSESRKTIRRHLDRRQRTRATIYDEGPPRGYDVAIPGNETNRREIFQTAVGAGRRVSYLRLHIPISE